MNNTGIITKIISNLYTVSVDGELYDCRARGKFRKDEITPLVGDFVVIDRENNYILEIKKRKNSLSRPMIANVDIALIMTSLKEPDLSLNLLDRELLCVENAGIEPIICLSKSDLLSKTEKNEYKKVFAYYKSIGYKVVKNTETFKIKRMLKGHTVVLTGQTGSGKSTILNRLDKKLDLKTSPISKALGRGVHTTRHVELFKVKGAFIADTPGFSALDLSFPKENLKMLFREFQGIECKFKDCEHIKEKGCGVLDAFDNGKIKQTRYENYVKFRGEMK